MEKRNHKTGRPSKMTPETLEKLEAAFLEGCSDTEAAFLAGISPSTLYHYQEKNPKYVERKNALKQNVTIEARREVLEAIRSGDTVTARWYLERKRPDEFTARQDLNVTAAGSLTLEERREALADFLAAFE